MSKSNNLITLNARIKFFGPYRIAEWIEDKQRNNSQRYQRFLSYANFHKSGKDKTQKPYILKSFPEYYTTSVNCYETMTRKRQIS